MQKNLVSQSSKSAHYAPAFSAEKLNTYFANIWLDPDAPSVTEFLSSLPLQDAPDAFYFNEMNFSDISKKILNSTHGENEFIVHPEREKCTFFCCRAKIDLSWINILLLHKKSYLSVSDSKFIQDR